ncbi:MAG TPA: FecR family protein [Candidatus Acidoferrales bacterium]|nr:FecR family protein [Candidatus Acidoferrales bacterium]
MKAFCASLLTVFLAAMPLIASPADSDKTLQNQKGTVTYGTSAQPTTPLAVKASTTLNDNDFAATGGNSLATITLPDSSQILMGSNSSVQMVSFSQTDMAHARFVVVGKMRFTVNHPSGAQADYHFQTTTGEIAVRGTVGDILSNPTGGLQVNVYAVTNPALPVQVTLVNGQVFTLAAGQSLVATAAAGAVTASVTSVSQSLFSPFSELGAPANASSLGITASTTAATTGAAGGAAGAAGGATAGIAAGAVGAAAAVTTISNNNTSTPAPAATATPTPQPSTTSVPITVNKAGSNNGGVHPGVRPGARPTPSVP